MPQCFVSGPDFSRAVEDLGIVLEAEVVAIA